MGGRLRIAGKGGMGEGDRPYRLNVEGEPGALEPLNDDRLDEGSMGGGNMADEGPLAEDIAGVSGVSCTEESSPAIADSTSLVDSRWKSLGRLALGVRLWRWGMRVFFPTAWASKLPFFVEIR